MIDTRKQSDKVFNFGETSYKSKGVMEIPVTWNDKKFYLKTEILEGDIPWLVGKTAMHNLGMVLNLKNNTAHIGALGGMEVKLIEDDQGHLRIPVLRRNVEELWLEGWRGKSSKEIRGTIMKLHLQFGHGSGEKIWKLTEEAKWSDGLEEEEKARIKRLVTELTTDCEVCKKYKRNPPKPVVGFSLGRTFNETVAIDVGEIQDKKFLVMVDLATRYCQAFWVKDKRPETIIGTLCNGWFAIFGAPANLLSDNGGEFQNEKVRRMTERWNIKVLTTAAHSPWSNGSCEKTVGIIKESLRKMKEEEGVDSTTALRWVVCARNCLVNNGGFSPNQLVFGKNPALPNLMGEEGSSPASREKGFEEKIVRESLNAMHKAREVFMKNESCNKIRIALNKNVREHKLEDTVVGDEVFYKRESENEWRGPARVIGVSGKTVVVKHGDSLREIARVHVTRIQGRASSSGSEENNKAEERRPMQDENEDKNGTEVLKGGWVMVGRERNVEREGVEREMRGQPTAEAQEEDEGMTGRRSEVEEEDTESEDEDRRFSEEGADEDRRFSEEGEDEDRFSEDEIPKLKKGNRIRAINKETRQREEWTILSLAGKKSSKLWSDSYNVQDSQTGDKEWINLRDYSEIEKIEDEEEVLLGFENNQVSDAKEKELQSWRENNVFEEVNDEGQKAISTRWIVTEKVKEGEKICKARLVARGFEEEIAEWEKDAPTCNAETLKFCLAVIKLKRWNCYTLDVKTAYLQGDEIKREVYLKPPSEGNWNGLWRLKKTVYGLKDAAKAWYNKVVKVVEELGGRRSRLEPNVFFWKKENKLVGELK